MKKLLIPALLLAGLALQPSLAAADPQGLEWRGGNGRDIWYRNPGEHDWRRAPGSAREVADGWVIGTDRRNGGYSIYRWDGRKWHRMPGSGVRIGGGYYNPWVINDRGERFSWNGYGWAQEPNFDRRNTRDNGRRDDRRDNHNRDRDDHRDNDNRGRDDNDWNRGRDRDNGDFDRGQGESDWRREQNRSDENRRELDEQWRRNRNR
jgi:hypothetical protein